jgi:hypothetical protein
LGGRAKLASIRNTLAAGVSEFESKMPSRKTYGKAVIIADGRDLMFVSTFASNEYPFEKIGYFSGKTVLPFVPTGFRSPLGAFIKDHPSLLSEGLFGGVMSRNWLLMSDRQLGSKIKASGTKKIDGKESYVVEYYPERTGSGDFTVRFYFDRETFHHIRTEYQRVIPPQSVPSGILGTQTGLELKVTEDFSDIRKFDGLSLPYQYRVRYLTSSNSGTFEYIWGIRISQYLLNQNLATDFFKFDEVS